VKIEKKGITMALETKTNLTEETISALNDLIQVNIDAQKGFDEAASEIQDLNIANMFRELSTQRSQQAMELQSLVVQNRQTPTDSGSIAGAIHRGWMNLRTALGGGNQVVLNEAERGEDHIKAKYEEALKCCTGSAVTDVLNRQYASVKKAHDRVRDLRDAYQE
jgi:uncharacterized protein (TIGR02284 family)